MRGCSASLSGPRRATELRRAGLPSSLELQTHGKFTALPDSRAHRRDGAMMGIQYGTHQCQTNPQTRSGAHGRRVRSHEQIEYMRH